MTEAYRQKLGRHQVTFPHVYIEDYVDLALFFRETTAAVAAGTATSLPESERR